MLDKWAAALERFTTTRAAAWVVVVLIATVLAFTAVPHLHGHQ